MLDAPWDKIAACMGPPNKREDLGEHNFVAEWEYSSASMNGSISLASVAEMAAPLIAIPVTILTGDNLAVSGAGDCRVMGVVKNGHLASWAFGGANSTMLSGKRGVCEPIFKGCE